jgi:PAS domain S-box-containing protein
MLKFFSIPDKEKNYQSYMVHVLCFLWTVVVVCIVSMGFIYFPHLWLRWVTLIAISLSIAILCLTLNSLGYTRSASWSLTIMLWLQISIPSFTAGGINAPGILQQMSVILTAGFLVGWRGGLAIGIISIAFDLYLVYLEINGILPIPTVLHTPLTRWIAAIIPFGTIIALQYFATDHLRSGLIALQNEVLKREEAEKTIKQTVYNLEERVKELKTLYKVSRVLQNDDTPILNLVAEIAEILPAGWQYPESAAACVCIDEACFKTSNYKSTSFIQKAKQETNHGTKLSVEVVYVQEVPELDGSPFLQEEQNLINMIAEMLKMHVEWRERRAELKEYKYALDLGYIISIANANGHLTFVNDNFCKISKYSSEELLGKHFSFISSNLNSQDDFNDLRIAMQDGKPFRGEFCNISKENNIFWADTTIVPFLSENGNVYQYLSISHDITERKEADDKIRQSEQLLKKITNQVPGNTYMFEIEESGHTKMLFVSRGKDIFEPSYGFGELSEYTEKLGEIIHNDDKAKFQDAMKEAYKTESRISFQYRIVVDSKIRWRWMQAVPEKEKSGKIRWYGATSDITPFIDYIASIEQIIFDIGHVIRRPLTSMLSMSKLILESNLSEKEIKEISKKLYLISLEMDKFTNELNNDYQKKRQNTEQLIDISSSLDKRISLFK